MIHPPGIICPDRVTDFDPLTISELILGSCIIRCTLHSAQYTAHSSVHCVRFTVLCTVQCTLCTIHCTVYNALCSILCAVHCTQYNELYTVHNALYYALYAIHCGVQPLCSAKLNVDFNCLELYYCLYTPSGSNSGSN